MSERTASGGEERGTKRGMLRAIDAVTLALALASVGLPVLAAESNPPDIVVVDGKFATRKASEVATNLSGIACAPAVAGRDRLCLVVDDEPAFAQRMFLTADGRIRPGDPVALIGKEPPSAGRAGGTPPDLSSCTGGSGGFRQFDGEGVAYAPAADGNATFYVVGSHGCSRSKAEARLSQFLLARVTLGPDGEQRGEVGLTWRLSELLKRAGAAGAYFAKPLGASSQQNGMNIEGISVVGDVVRVGLRAPSLNGAAFIVEASLEWLFAEGNPAAPDRPLLEVALGRDVGIRDMAALPYGRLLLLTGAAQEQADVGYRLALVTPPATPGGQATQRLSPRWVADLQGNANRKAEAVAVLSADADEARVLILYDGVENGGPEIHRVRLR